MSAAASVIKYIFSNPDKANQALMLLYGFVEKLDL